MADIIFYTNPLSRGRIVRWALEEVGRPYQTTIVEFGAALQAAEFRAINPMGKVPALVHEGAVITECAAICAYLAATFPECALAPDGGSALADYYRWLFFAAGPFESAVTNQAMKFEVPSERARMSGYGSLSRVLDTLDSLLTTRDFVAGGRFSAADLYLGSGLMWAMLFGTIEKRPVFETYVDRLKERPAFTRAAELDDAAAAAQSQAKGSATT